MMRVPKNKAFPLDIQKLNAINAFENLKDLIITSGMAI
jgi:hypothetical protein